MTYPTPTGAAPASFTTISGQPEAYYQQLFAAHWGAAAGTAYASWNAKNPANDAYTNAQSFMVMVTTQGIARAIATVGTFVGSSLPNAAAGALANTSAVKGAGAVESALTAVPDFLSRLTSANLWERIGEVVIGLILICVGVAHITHAVPIATHIAKSVGAAAVMA
jgi:hypothetical protein